MDIERIKSILYYNSGTGDIVWRVTNRRKKANNAAGSIRFEDAVKVRKAAEIKYGFHNNHGA